MTKETAAMQQMDVTFGERLRLERKRRAMRLDHAAAAAQEMLPAALSMSRELLRRIEAGLIPEAKVNPLHIAALAQVYGIKLKELHPESLEATRVVGALVKASSKCIALQAA